jgi:hypothetical protein
MAAEAECADLAEGAGDPEIAADTVRQLMAHQLAAGHGLAMGLTARARRLVGECTAADQEDGGRRSAELLRFVAGTARLMERCRAAAIALDRIGYPEPPEGPDDDGPHRCDHPHHYAWRLSNERLSERRRVLDWLAQGKKAAELPDVDGWPPYHNPDPEIEKLDERLARATDRAAPRHATPGLKRGRLKNSNPSGDYLTAPRCGAATRAGGSCRQPAMRNGRCRFHGGKSTGPRTAAGLQRSGASRLTHGFRTAEIIDLRSAAARVGRNLYRLTRAAQASASQEGFTTKSQRTRSQRGSGVFHTDNNASLDSGAAYGRADNPPSPWKSAPSVSRHGSFVPFVTLWCKPSSSHRSAGHGVHCPKLKRPAERAPARKRLMA